MNGDNKRQYVFAAILLLVIFYYFWDAGYFSKNSETQVQAASMAASPATHTPPTITIRDMSRINGLLKNDWPEDYAKDPFYYVTADLQGGDGLLFDKASKASSLDLTGISCISNSCTAVINSNILREGDVISGYKLDKIAFRYVILNKGDQSIRLILTQ